MLFIYDITAILCVAWSCNVGKSKTEYRTVLFTVTLSTRQYCSQ